MKPGDVLKMRSCTATDAGLNATLGPPEGSPKGTRMVFLFLGNVAPGETFDPVEALRRLGYDAARGTGPVVPA